MGWLSTGMFPIGVFIPLAKNPETFPNPSEEGILAEDGDFLVTEGSDHLVTE